MSIDDSFRRLRGAVGNALVWGGGWFALVFAGFATLRLVGILPEAVSVLDGFVLAAKFGVVGVVAGGAFAGVVRLLYSGRRLSEISWVRFALGGAIATGVFIPVLLQTLNLLSGDGFVAMEYVLDDAVLTAVFGGIAAGGSLRLAQRGDAALRGGGGNRFRDPARPERLARGKL